MIHPGSSEELPVRLLAKAPGMLHHTIRIAVFGSSQPPLVSGSACVGVQVVCRSEYRHGAYSLILLLFCFRKWPYRVLGTGH